MNSGLRIGYRNEKRPHHAPAYLNWSHFTLASLVLTCALQIGISGTLPAEAKTLPKTPVSSLHAKLRIAGAMPDHPKAHRLPGTISLAKGQWHLTQGFVDEKDTKVPGLDALDFDPKAQRLTATSGRTGQKSSLDPTALRQHKWSEIPSSPDALGAFLLIGKDIRAKGHFLRTTKFQRQSVQEYSFVESHDVFGRVLYSPSLGIPVKLEVFDIKQGKRSFIELQDIKP